MSNHVHISTDRALEYLCADPFSNLMTLKMLTMYRESCQTFFYESADGWALRTELPAEHSHWDRQAYPGYRTIVMIDGTGEAPLHTALVQAPSEHVVFKLHDPYSIAQMKTRDDAAHQVSFISYSESPAADPIVPGIGSPAEVHSEYSEEAAPLFAENLYTRAEMEEHLARGARWFGVRHGTVLSTVCLAFPIYSNIWEIGGVFTLPAFRGRGYARTVVAEALSFIRGKSCRPRYQFKEGNGPSQALAESVGLIRVLAVAHYTTQR